jgi:DNA segregation ATPase FtsK/SpoIIIE, S-DNA-T family
VSDSTIETPGSDTAIEFNRPPRIYRQLPSGDFRIAAPPTRSGQPQRLNPVSLFTPVLLLGVSSIYLLQYSGGNQTLALVALGAMMLATLLGTILNFVWERRSRRLEEAEQIVAYRQLLEEQATELRELQREERHNREINDPDLNLLLKRAQECDIYLWQRRPTDPDFLALRMGVGQQLSSINVIPPDAVGSQILVDTATMPGHSNPAKQSKTLRFRRGANSAGVEGRSPTASQLSSTGNKAAQWTLLQEARRLAEDLQQVADVPVTMNLQSVGSIGIAGDQSSDSAANLLRAMIMHLATHHAPDEVRIAGVLTGPKQAEWAWLADLPHATALRQDSRVPMIATTPEQVEQLMTELLDELSRRDQAQQDRPDNSRGLLPPYIVLILIGDEQIVDHITTGLILRRGKDVRASVICLVNHRKYIPGEVGALILTSGAEIATYQIATPGGASLVCRHRDVATVAQCVQLVQALKPIRMRATTGVGDLNSNIRLLPLLGYDLQTYNAMDAWSQPKKGEFCTILGKPAGSKELLFDLVADGPHGLIAGTTGAGKSELLQTLILGFAMTHDPRRLNFVLVDYKGGGSLGIFQELPHNVGLITNLQGRLAERALIAFDAELKRRQQKFAELGAGDIITYDRLRRNTDPIMPRLMIVIDEFAELARELPDFMARLISIAQIGRTLGIHLLLATQRPAGVVSANISANINYRICLRVVSVEESRDVLGRPDAAHLPHNRPGRAYFQIGHDIFTLFQSARVAVPYTNQLPAALMYQDESTFQGHIGHGTESAYQNDTTRDNVLLINDGLDLLSDGGDTDMHHKTATDPQSVPRNPSEAQVIVALLRHDAIAHGLGTLAGPWSDPLPEQVTLPDVLRRAAEAYDVDWTNVVFRRRDNGWFWPSLQQTRWLRAPVGLVDDITAQEHRPLVFDFQSEGGHLMISGSAGSGKSTLLRTLVVSLALTHDPANIWFYMIDFGGLSLSPLCRLPHVGDQGLFKPNEVTRIRRLLRWLRMELDERKRHLGEAGISNLWEYRRVVRANEGRSQATPPPALMVIIDNFAGFREVFDDDLPTLVALARDGKAAGIHLVITLDRPSSLPGALASNIELRFALRLADQLESFAILNKPDASQIDVALPGRGFLPTRPLLECQIALPAQAGDEDGRAIALGRLAEQMRAAWRGPFPERIELLSEYVVLEDLLASTAAVIGQEGRYAVPIACDDQTLRPIAIDLQRDGPHMMVAGSARSGKSVVLRSWARALSASARHQGDVQLVCIGLRRSLRSLRGLSHILRDSYAETLPQLSELTVRLQSEFERRRDLAQELTGLATVTVDNDPSVLGPALVILIDDCELLLSAASDEARALGEIAKGSRDLGIHFIAAGNVEEIGRSYETLAQILKSARAGVLLRVNEPADGLILGVRLPYNMQPTDYPPGRGYLVTSMGPRLVQCAISDSIVI